jgi:hypothetical protein
MVVTIDRSGAPGADPLGGVGRLVSTKLSVRTATGNGETGDGETGDGTLVGVADAGVLRVPDGRDLVAVAPPPPEHATQSSTSTTTRRPAIIRRVSPMDR